MLWTDFPDSVLVVRKHSDCNVIDPLCQLTSWLVKDMGLKVYVEGSDLSDSVLDQNEDFKDMKNHLFPFVECEENNTDDLIDFVICLGGDRTLLHASSMFQGPVPPVMAFNVGSRGFLTPFQFGPDFQQCVSEVMEGLPSIFFRYRLDCILNFGTVVGLKETTIGASSIKARHLVLNEVVLNRGPSSTQSNFEIFIGNRLVTSLQGDGLIMSTPTGSTAYSVSAGASMVHPGVPCVLITPICPHSLSFRPVIVPAGVQIKVKLCGDTTDSTCMVCFDGRDRQEMKHGEVLIVSTARHPLPSICSTNQTEDWFDSLDTCLNWNIRMSQKPMETRECHPNNITVSKPTTEVPQMSFRKTASNSNPHTIFRQLETCETPQRPIGMLKNKAKFEVKNRVMAEPEKYNHDMTVSVSEDRFHKLSDNSKFCQYTGDSMFSKMCRKSTKTNEINSNFVDSSFRVPHQCSETKDNDVNVIMSSVTSETSQKSRDHSDSRKYSIVNVSSPRLPHKQYSDRESYHNALNCNSTEAMLVKMKDNNFNDVTFISSDGHRIPYCISDKNHKEIYPCPITSFPCNFVEDSCVEYSFVNSSTDILDNNTFGTKRVSCDRTSPNTTSKECKNLVKSTQSNKYNNAVNSLSIDVPQKDSKNFISSIKSFMVETETSQTATTVAS